MADVSVSYRPPKPFQSPFVVQPRKGVVKPRSDGAFKVTSIPGVVVAMVVPIAAAAAVAVAAPTAVEVLM